MRLHVRLQYLFFSITIATSNPRISFSKTWQILGPFQIGTREAAWGADPLELYHGFHALKLNETASFPSSLAPNGSISWSTATADLTTPNSSTASLSVSFPNIIWPFHQQVYGWAGLQWQAWARGSIHVSNRSGDSSELVTATFQTSPIVEFWIDDTHYWGGDFYGFDRAPLVLHLKPGEHVVELRLLRDVRAMGGIADTPTVDVEMEVVVQSGDEILVQHAEALVPDLLFWPGENESKGWLASEFVEVVVRNQGAGDNVWVSGIKVEDAWLPCNISLTSAPIKFVPGQTRLLGLRVSCDSLLPPGSATIPIRALYYTSTSHHHSLGLTIKLLKPQSLFDPHLITHLHPSGTISQSLIRPPSRTALNSCLANSTRTGLPILLILHGAGVEVSSSLTRESLNALPDLCAWTLWPSGVTAWSSDDWHAFGMRDIRAAIASIPSWRRRHPLSRSPSWPSGDEHAWPEVDTDHWLVAGHSNGGQGTWATLLHSPDNVIAAAPVSGYSSIQNYVPYSLWRPAEAGKMAVVQGALEGWRHEVLLPNAKGIPILEQHGGADDNVPPYHSRLMHQLLPEDDGWHSEYNEFPGKPHWWDGVMTTVALREFFEEQLSRYLAGESASREETRWEIVTANPAETGSKQGVKILLLVRPGRLGRATVECKAADHARTSEPGAEQTLLNGEKHKRCDIRTSNVRSLQISVKHATVSNMAMTKTLFVDGQRVSIASPKTTVSDLTGEDGSEGGVITLLRCRQTGTWAFESLESSPHPPEDAQDLLPQRVRWGAQLGSLDAVLRTQGPLQILTHLPPSATPEENADEMQVIRKVALQISRNMQAYFHADSTIMHLHNAQESDAEAFDAALTAPGNIITLALGSALPSLGSMYYRVQPTYAHAVLISPSGDTLSIRDSTGEKYVYSAGSSSPQIAAIFLRPLPFAKGSPERVELVVWGSSAAALEQAARLVPLMTGTGQPDFVVLGGEAKWKGLQGALALGWLDEFWEATPNSFFG